MARLTLSLSEDLHEDLRELARQKDASMSAILRYALDKTFEDELDVIAGNRALEEARRDPSSTMSLREYVASRKGKGRG
ncbi:MAG: ribbon-helix-helix protein, CopG family [Chloroflexi bacterium]|nr:ribbon-helix-helix protein, CopG family [Chloroflexota bacterium]